MSTLKGMHLRIGLGPVFLLRNNLTHNYANAPKNKRRKPQENVEEIVNDIRSFFATSAFFAARLLPVHRTTLSLHKPIR